MTSNTPNNGLRSLAKLAAKTRITCRIVCGSQAQIGHAVTNIYGVLRRLQEEASNERSALTRSGTACKEDLSSLCIDCGIILNDVNNFLRAHKTLSDIEVRILGVWESSFTDRQKAIIDHFEPELVRYASRLSQVLIAASTDSMCELKEQLDFKTSPTGYPLSTILNDLTSRLVANDGRLVASGDLRFSMLVKDPRNEEVLWGALQHELLGNGLERASLDQHRNITLRYIRALERRSAFRSSDEAPIDGTKKEGSAKTQEGKSKAPRLHDRAKRKSDAGDGDEYSKRARSNLDQPPQLPFGTKADANSASTSREDKKFFRFRDPQVVFGPAVNDDFLADFLEEEPGSSQQHDLRNQIRVVYRTLYEDYEPRYEYLVFQGSCQDGEKNAKEYKALTHEVEKKVIFKLDELEVGSDPDLRHIRKMIVNKAQQILDDLEKIKG